MEYLLYLSNSMTWVPLIHWISSNMWCMHLAELNCSPWLEPSLDLLFHVTIILWPKANWFEQCVVKSQQKLVRIIFIVIHFVKKRGVSFFKAPDWGSSVNRCFPNTRLQIRLLTFYSASTRWPAIFVWSSICFAAAWLNFLIRIP